MLPHPIYDAHFPTRTHSSSLVQFLPRSINPSSSLTHSYFSAGRCVTLEELNLDHNKLRSVPMSICSLTNLREVCRPSSLPVAMVLSTLSDMESAGPRAISLKVTEGGGVANLAQGLAYSGRDLARGISRLIAAFSDMGEEGRRTSRRGATDLARGPPRLFPLSPVRRNRHRDMLQRDIGALASVSSPNTCVGLCIVAFRRGLKARC
jgi:hypothetical protein